MFPPIPLPNTINLNTTFVSLQQRYGQQTGLTLRHLNTTFVSLQLRDLEVNGEITNIFKYNFCFSSTSIQEDKRYSSTI